MRSCRHSASSATLGRGLHRRVDPLAERQGALAAHTAAVVRLEADLAAEVHALDWHPHFSHITCECTGALHCAQQCPPLGSTKRGWGCMRHKASTGPLARRCRSSCCGQPQKPSPLWRVGGNAPGRETSCFWYPKTEKRIRGGRASLRLRTAGQHLPRGGVNTFEHLYGCGVNR